MRELKEGGMIDEIREEGEAPEFSFTKRKQRLDSSALCQERGREQKGRAKKKRAYGECPEKREIGKGRTGN